MSSLVKVNSEVREDFRLTRLVRQGCLLASYLFILATDVLGHMLDDPKHGVKRLLLPKGNSGIRLSRTTLPFTSRAHKTT